MLVVRSVPNRLPFIGGLLLFDTLPLPADTLDAAFFASREVTACSPLSKPSRLE